MKILHLFSLPVAVVFGILAGLLLAIVYYVRVIRGMRMLMSREDRTLDTVASVRRAGGA